MAISSTLEGSRMEAWEPSETGLSLNIIRMGVKAPYRPGYKWENPKSQCRTHPAGGWDFRSRPSDFRFVS